MGATLGARAPVAIVPTSGSARWARGSTVGLTATGLAMTGHAVGGGSAPPAMPLAILITGAVLGSVGLSGRRWTLGLLLGVLLTAQGAFHVAFGPAATAPTTGSTPSWHSGSAGHVAVAHQLGWGMVGAHLVAALLTALLLRRGETWCWRLAALIASPMRTAQLLAAPVAVPPVPSAVGVDHGPMVRPASRLVHSQARRGPPPALAV